jgi:hypothetical protein
MIPESGHTALNVQSRDICLNFGLLDEICTRDEGAPNWAQTSLSPTDAG